MGASRSHLQAIAVPFKSLSPTRRKNVTPTTKNALFGFAGGPPRRPQDDQKRSPRRLDIIIRASLSLTFSFSLGFPSILKMCILPRRGPLFQPFGYALFGRPEVALRGSKTALRAPGLAHTKSRNAATPTQNAHFQPCKTAPRRLQDVFKMHTNLVLCYLAFDFSRDAYKIALSSPKKLPERPPRAPKRPQEAPKRLPRSLQKAPKRRSMRWRR